MSANANLTPKGILLSTKVLMAVEAVLSGPGGPYGPSSSRTPRWNPGENIVVSDGIINSAVDANQRIICQGKRATIVGGHLRASEEVHAKNLGSVAGAETIVEVGYDPKSIENIQRLEKEVKAFDEQVEEIDLNIHTLENIKKMKKELPEEKEQYLTELQDQKQTIEEKRDEKMGEIKSVQEYLASLKVNGKVSASGKIYPGVKVVIKDASLKIRNEF